MNRTFPASLPRSRTPGTLTGTAPIPVITSRSGRWPCRTDRAPPSSVRFPEWASSNTERSASTACWIRSRPPTRRMSVSGSAENPCGSGKAVRVVVVRWHILFSARMTAPQQRHDMPPIRGHHKLSTISPSMIKRSPRGDHPRCRVRFVFTAVSSIKTKCSGCAATAGRRCRNQSSRCHLIPLRGDAR